jgi:voltage-gated potassium channel Kch
MKRAGGATAIPRRHFGRFTRIWGTEVGLSVFTGLLALQLFVVSPLANLGVFGNRSFESAFSLLLVWGAFALHPGRLLRVLVGICVGLAVGLRWTTAWLPVPWIAAAGSLLAVVTLGCFSAIVLKRVFEPGPVTRHRIHGAVCAYLLFGLMWAAAYAFIAQVVPDPFSVATDVGHSESVIARFVYFSFVTLTTVGYGDITAVHPLARTLVTIEALIGQLYPAIIIGDLVSSALANRPKA